MTRSILLVLAALSLAACSETVTSSSAQLPGGHIAGLSSGRDVATPAAEPRTVSARDVHPAARAREIGTTLHFECRSCSR